AAFWREWRVEQAGRGERPGPVALIGHSMGGHLALRALAQGRVDPDALVLSAPMLGFAAGGAPFWSQKALGWAMLKLGDARRPAWSGGEKPASSLHARKGLLTHDARRYQQEMDWRAARPELAMGPASWGWMAAGLRSMETFMAPGVLERVETPVLILSTAADGLVCHRANLKAAQRLPHGEIMSFGPEAAHEILREVDAVRAPAMARIEAFLGEHVALPIRSDLTRAL
ncbi:alpha/beta fold hydrolase, partial [Novosphingobium sp. SCN 63-17]